jgi:beta-mannosidase
MELSGTWRARPADDDVRRSGIGLDADDRDWSTVPVPGHWRCTPEFADSDGPLLYRTSFDLPAPGPDERTWIRVGGAFYQADVWFDGAYLGDPEGYFVPAAFDVTALARLTEQHVLAIEVSCPPQPTSRNRRTLTGSFQGSDAVAPGWNPGGLWRPVEVLTTGPVRIDRCRVLCRDANASRAHLRLATRLDSDRACKVQVLTVVDGDVLAEHDHALAKGTNELAWAIDVGDPRLWWPWSLGDQPLTGVTVEVRLDGAVSDRHHVVTGLREVAFDDGIVSVNGERLYTKGVVVGPTHLDLARVDAGALRRDVESARDAGLDLLRLKGHITRDELYTAADELGMLVWQDFPLQGGYARSVRRQAVEQARAAVDMLGHHPSILLWCAHDTPETRAVGQQLPTWNKTVLDRWVKRALEKADETRPVIAHSGVAPHLPQLEAPDSHLWFGWGRGEVRDLTRFAASMPSMVRFVSEFGAQSVPDSADFIDSTRWPRLDWAGLADRHGLDRSTMERYVPPAREVTFAAWREATQQYQAEVLRLTIETLRRLKFRPTGGFCLSSLVDAAPLVSTSLLDHRRRPKLAFDAVADACRPVVVVAEQPPASIGPGERCSLDVHVVSDLRTPLADVRCTATVSGGGLHQQWTWEGDVPADSCVRVGEVRFIAPPAGGDVVLDLVLELAPSSSDAASAQVVTNRYRTTVAR